MTANALRCRIIAHVLKADRLHLDALYTLCEVQRSIDLPAELPDWLTLAHAADLLHLHPAHLRRMVNDRFPLQVEKRRTAKGQIGTFIAAAAVRDIASANVRQSRATQAVKRARLAGNARLPARAHPDPQDTDSTSVLTAGSAPSKEPVQSKVGCAPTPETAAPSKLPASPAARS